MVLAILYGRRRRAAHAWETVKGSLWLGVAVGLGAATGQALGSLIARPVMAAGFDPFAASLLRVGVAAARPDAADRGCRSPAAAAEGAADRRASRR